MAHAVAATLSSVMVFYLIPYYIDSTNMACVLTNFKANSNITFVQFCGLERCVYSNVREIYIYVRKSLIISDSKKMLLCYMSTHNVDDFDGF